MSFDEDYASITMEANKLLTKLNKSYLLLQKLNQEIESRPFSTRIHGQFEHELKKSQSIISKLSTLLRKYYSFEFSSSLSVEIKENDDSSSAPIDTSFIIDFKDLCLKIEREWRIGTQLIHDFEYKYDHKHRYKYAHASEHCLSDTEARYNKKHKKHKKHKRQRSHSPSIHSFSNPNSPLFRPMDHKRINLSHSQSEIVQKQTFLNSKDMAYNLKIGSDFVPFDEDEKLNQNIRDINDDLQYLLVMNKQMNDLVMNQQQNVDEMGRKVGDAKDNIQYGADALNAIRKSRITYGIMGGIAMAALGAPIVLIGAGVKAALGSSIGLGTIGVFTGSVYANKVNQQMDEEQMDCKQQKLMHTNSNESTMSVEGKPVGAFQTKPRKRMDKNKRNVLSDYDYRNMDDDADDIDVWDARN